MEEQWKPIEGFSGYEISNKGNVRSYLINGGIRKTPYVLKPKKNPNGYLFVNLHIGQHICKSKYIHRIVAQTFISNPNGYSCINHKDENKCNNDVTNLEWCTYKYNANYGTSKYRIGEANKYHGTKEIFQFNIKGDFIKSYFSCAEASRETGLKEETISSAALHKTKYAGKWLWSYDKDYNFNHEITSIGEHVYLKYFQVFEQYNLEGILMHTYIGFEEIQHAFKEMLGRTRITNVCNGYPYTAYGYKWKFGGPTFKEYIKE